MRKHFLTGIATLFPVFVTVYIIVAIINFTDNLIGNYVNDLVYNEYGFVIPGLGLIAALMIIFAVGLVYNIFFGHKLFPIFENIFKRLPLVRNIYPSAKQLSDFMFGSRQKENFQKVVLVQFPEKGTYSIGFITNENIDELKGASDEQLVSVFVPLAPAPFSGHILLVPRERVREIDLPIDRAIKFVVSGGVVLSEDDTQLKMENKC